MTDRIGAIRVQKYLSQAGVASRREAERLMDEGRVRVNGVVVTELGARVDPDRDLVEVDGERVAPAPVRWVAFHKPSGAVTSRRAQGGDKTIYDLLPKEHVGLHYVGRLDRETVGLLLLTNDGDVAQRLLHPEQAVEREYRVEVVGALSDQARSRLLRGVELEDGPARVARINVLKKSRKSTRVELVLLEGRKREVRRLCEAVGHPVIHLSRVRFGAVELGELQPGECRALTIEEVRALEESVGLQGE